MDSPFLIFEQCADRLRIGLFTKKDDLSSDMEAASALGAGTCASVSQVHGNRTIVIREALSRTIEADGLITDQRGLALMIRAADCQNFVIYAPESNVVGLLHVGWRGLIAGAIQGFYEALKAEWDVDPGETLVGAGPSLCTRCAEFTNPETELPSIDSRFFHGRCVDLQGIADETFRSLGVLRKNMERHPDCTRCNPEKYWTYRGGDRASVMQGKANILACVFV